MYGDVTNERVLRKLGIDKARELVLLINDPNAGEQAVRVARELAPDLFISIRIPYLQDVESLQNAGANDVIASEREAAVQISSQVLKRTGIEQETCDELASEVRSHTDPNGLV